MKACRFAVSLALTALLCSASGDGGHAGCDGPGGTCTSGHDQDDPSALQLHKGQRELSSNYSVDPDEADKILDDFANTPIFQHIQNFAAAAERNTCVLTPSNSCPITNSSVFKPKNATKVYPGGKTQCLDGSEFFFEVTVGNPEKLHIHFQAGGACWDWISFKKPACSLYAVENAPDGIFNLSNPLNPLKDYSLIVIQYCGGDMHAGNTEQKWGKGGTMVKQVGYQNADAAIKYALGQFPKLDNLVISGSSAGSLGVQFWSGKVIDLFADRQPDVAVIGDSFLGVLWPADMVEQSETWLIAKYKMCNPAVMTAAQLSKCNEGKLLLQDVFVDSIEAHPDARFSVINSKADGTQIYFEQMFELTAEHNLQGWFMTPGQFYKSASLMVVDFLQQSNLYSYLVDGTNHTYLPGDWLYTTSPEGYNNTDGSPLLIDWLTDFVSPSQQAAKSVCFGPEKNVSASTPVSKHETSYCAEGLVNIQR